MKTAFCQQIDSKQFRSEAQGNTNEALLMLYQQFMEMPDGPQKRHFLESVSDVLLEILQRQLLTLSLEAYENSSLRSFFQNMYFLFNVFYFCHYHIASNFVVFQGDGHIPGGGHKMITSDN